MLSRVARRHQRMGGSRPRPPGDQRVSIAPGYLLSGASYLGRSSNNNQVGRQRAQVVTTGAKRKHEVSRCLAGVGAHPVATVAGGRAGGARAVRAERLQRSQPTRRTANRPNGGRGAWLVRTSRERKTINARQSLGLPGGRECRGLGRGTMMQNGGQRHRPPRKSARRNLPLLPA